MKIGLTYDLRKEYLDLGYSLEETAEFDRPDTVDAIESALRELGFNTERIGNFQALQQALLRRNRWDLVFNICEGLYGYGREALVPCLLDAYRIPYVFSDPLVLALTLHKGMCKRVIRDLGVPTPGFEVVERLEDLAGVNLEYPLFAKPIAEGTGKGIDASSLVTNETELSEVCRQLLSDFHQPVLVETYLPGDEYTVGIVGTDSAARSVGILEVRVKTRDAVYSYESKERCEEMVDYTLAELSPEQERDVVDVALNAWRGLGCRDGGRVDLKLDKNGSAQFLEVNPLAGLNPVHSDLPIMCSLAGHSYGELISWIMDSALRRRDHAHHDHP